MTKFEIDIELSEGQIRKFRKLFDQIKIINGKAYFLTRNMHGVLLTNSKQSAFNIVQANLQYVQIYIRNIDDEQYIKHIGIDILLDKLAENNPKKKTQYLAARAHVSAWLANDPKIFKDAALKAAEWDKNKIQIVEQVKRYATHCALTKIPFKNGIECHVHHIEGVSERPELADRASNLIPLCGQVHDEYHSWIILNELPITRATLKQFSNRRGYNRNWSTFTGDVILSSPPYGNIEDLDRSDRKFQLNLFQSLEVPISSASSINLASTRKSKKRRT